MSSLDSTYSIDGTNWRLIRSFPAALFEATNQITTTITGDLFTVTVETDLSITANFLPLLAVKHYLFVPVIVRQNE